MSSSSSFMETGGGLHHAYSRKQKSLGLLCTNFLGLYDRAGVESVGLDDAARRLCVERRRIYDIVNVLESVGVLMRKAKNRYSWIGWSGIPKALEALKEEALKENFGGEGPSFRSEDLEVDEDNKSLDHSGDYGEGKLCVKAKAHIENRKEKSLSMLTENFVKLFLTTNVALVLALTYASTKRQGLISVTWGSAAPVCRDSGNWLQAETVSLDEAAKLLLGDAHESNHMKTKVRRLYDIANVLSSLNLIVKTQQADTRKPAFQWLGFSGKRDNGVTVAIPPSPSKGCKRGFGLDITNVDLTKRSKLVPSGDKKPVKFQMRSEDLKENNAMASKQLQGSKGYVFGPFSPIGLVIGGKNDEGEGGKQVKDLQTLADLHMPEYQNEALSELFAHYKEAWKRWYTEVAQVGKFV